MEYVDGSPVGVVPVGRPLEARSCAVGSRGPPARRAAVIQAVPKNYNCDSPREDAERVRDALRLP